MNERPKCHWCEKGAYMLIGDKFACGDHILKYQKAVNEIQNKAMDELMKQ